MAAAAAASIAGVSALAAYLDAKYHIGQDLRIKRRVGQAAKYYQELVKHNRLSLWYAFTPHVTAHPNEECIWSRTGSYTWQQAHDRAIQWARFFLSKGVKPGDLVGVYLINSVDFPVIWLGLLCIGCAPALLNYNLKGDALAHCVRISGARVLLVDSDGEVNGRFHEVRGRLEEEMGVEGTVVTDQFLADLYKTSVNVPGDEYRAGVKGNSPTCLLYTSGTTGLPKAAPFLTSRYHERGNPANPPFGQTTSDRWYCSMPLFHGTGGLSIMSSLTLGLSVAVGRKFSVSTHWDDIHDSGASVFVYVGEAARYLLNAPPHPLERNHPRLRAMYGNGMRPDVWSRFKKRFDVPQVIEFFNSTEGVLSMVNWSLNGYTQDCVGRHGAILRHALRDTYVPVAIDTETGNILRDPATGFARRNAYDEGGEILVKVPSEAAFAGYVNNPAANAKKFERDVLVKGDLYYRSGDSLRRDADGRWFFLDRLGDTFRWKSENVSTAQVAEVLGKYPGVAEATVYGVTVPNHDGRAGCAAVLLADGVTVHSFDWKAFLEYAKGELVKEAVPVFVRVVGQSSRTDNEKQNKGPLKAEGIEVSSFGEKVVGGKGDVMMWLGGGRGTYELFGARELEDVKGGRARL
ncbi:hypothetical protein DPSP01_007998 [Paraphaeosphaeria sporulosa]|uniref:Very long-chain fatty acid transport protein n=1 Tax=Paraphaeosphaeria sporulosa TaxID=1460663 RepID=A0A177CEF4_9PLEO|nr:acetyl-CoA synthetase-like protein [Paraphaeosphaeria sporulosa]OAG05591.1 acetyl-CoA synthetase-like protein [Paraphaeosphaeria sporulosa]